LGGGAAAGKKAVSSKNAPFVFRFETSCIVSSSASMNRTQRDQLIRLIASPPAGSKIAAAEDFGIDLTLLVRRLELTPTERLQELAAT
jgi:hypothetical protein